MAISAQDEARRTANPLYRNVGPGRSNPPAVPNETSALLSSTRRQAATPDMSGQRRAEVFNNRNVRGMNTPSTDPTDTVGSSDRVRGAQMRGAENPYTLKEGDLVTRGQRKNNPTVPVVGSSALGGVASSGQMGRGNRGGSDPVIDNSIPDDQLPDNLLKFDGSNFGAASDREVQALIGGDSRPSGVRGDQNFLTRADGSRLYASDYGNNVNTMDMGAANSAMAEANAIRQRQIDAQPERRRGPQAPPDMASILANVDTRGLSTSAGRAMRQGVIEQTIGQYAADRDNMSRERVAQMNNQNQLLAQQIRSDGTLEAARMGDEAAMERAVYAANTLPMSDLMAMINDPDQTEEGRMYFEDLLEQRLLGEVAEDRSYAEGGLVEPVTPMGAMAGMGGEYGQAPQQPMQAEVQEYQRYVSGAKGMGIPAVPFEEFLQMKEGAAALGGGESAMPQMVKQPQGALAFAEGGEVPDVMDASGATVIDPDPMAGTDSIPAMIDGQVPAKLDSGEFVLPEDVTRFFGTKKLNDMIQQARSAMQEANASPGPAM